MVRNENLAHANNGPAERKRRTHVARSSRSNRKLVRYGSDSMFASRTNNIAAQQMLVPHSSVVMYDMYVIVAQAAR